MIRRPPRSTLFPYTTLFRSVGNPACKMPGLERIYLGGQRPISMKTKAILAGALAVIGLITGCKSIPPDRKSTRLNSSHGYISYAVFCLKKKKKNSRDIRYHV